MTRIQAGLTAAALIGAVYAAFGEVPVLGGVVAVVALVVAVVMRERRAS